MGIYNETITEMKNGGGPESLELEKLRLEVEELKRRLEGKDPQSITQLIQTLVVVLGVVFTAIQTIVVVLGVVFTASQIYLAVRDNNRKDLLTASEHLHDGYPPAAAWLAEHGSEGLRVLVQSVDADHSLEQKAWPLTTRAALRELHAHSKSLTDQDRKDLDEAMLRNDAALRAALKKYGDEKTLETMTQIANLRCVQLDLQAVVGKQPPAWGSTARNIDAVFLGRPRPC